MPREKQARWQKQQPLAVSGRSHLANADKVFERAAGLTLPHAGDTLPIYLIDTIPKDLFFPFEEGQIADEFSKMPASDAEGISHIWLRRPRASEFRNGRIPLSEYIAWGNIALIALYPWPTTLRMPLTKKPTDQILNRYRRWAPRLTSHKGKWHLEWTAEHAAEFCIGELVRHMVSVHAEFRAKHLAREAKRGEELPAAYAQQRFFEENLVIT